MAEAKRDYPITTTAAWAEAAQVAYARYQAEQEEKRLLAEQEKKRCFDAALQLASDEVVFMDDALKNDPRVKKYTAILRNILKSTTREFALDKAKNGAGETPTSLEKLDQSQIDAVMTVWDKQLETKTKTQEKSRQAQQEAEALHFQQAMEQLQPRMVTVQYSLNTHVTRLSAENSRLGDEQLNALATHHAYRQALPALPTLFAAVTEAYVAQDVLQLQADLAFYREQFDKSFYEGDELAAIQDGDAPHIGERWGRVLAAIDGHTFIGKSRGDAVVQHLLNGDAQSALAVLDEKKLAPGLGGTGLFAGKKRKTIGALRQMVAALAPELTALPDSVRATIIQHPQADYSQRIEELRQLCLDVRNKERLVVGALEGYITTVDEACYQFRLAAGYTPLSRTKDFSHIFTPAQAQFLAAMERDYLIDVPDLHCHPAGRQSLSITPELCLGLADDDYAAKIPPAIGRAGLRMEQLHTEITDNNKVLDAIDFLNNHLSQPVTSYADVAARRTQIEQAEKLLELLNAPKTPAVPATPGVYRAVQAGVTMSVDFRSTPLLNNG